jgi:hypothetical protein
VASYQKGLKDIEKGVKGVGNEVDKTAQKTKKGFDDATKSTSKFTDSLEQIGSNIPFLSQITSTVSGIGNAFGGATKGVAGMSKGMGALKTAIMSSGIGALIVALGSLAAYFTSSDQGATKLEATMNGLGSAFGVLTGKASDLGESLLDTFSKATEDGSTFNKILTASYEVVNVLSGGVIKIVADQFSGLATEMKEAYSEGARLTEELDAINDAMRSMQVDSAVANNEIQRLIKTLRNRELSATERMDNLKRAEEIEQSLFEKEFEHQKALYQNSLEQLLLDTKNINQTKIQQNETLKRLALESKHAQSTEELVSLYKQMEVVLGDLKSVDDEQAQGVVDNLVKVINMEGQVLTRRERYEALKSGLIEKEIAERTEAIKKIENLERATALKAISDKEQQSKAILDAEIKSIDAQIKLRKQYNKDYSELELQKQELLQKYNDEQDKLREERAKKELEDAKKLVQEYNSAYIEQTNLLKQQMLERVKNGEDASTVEKEYTRSAIETENSLLETTKELRVQAGEDAMAIDQKILDNKLKLSKMDLEDTKKTEEEKKRVREAVATESAKALDLISNEVLTQANDRLERENSNIQAQTDLKISEAQRELEAGIISQDQFNQKKAVLEQKQRQKENEIKRKQAQNNKTNALFEIALNTAIAVSKVWGQTGVAGTFAQLLPIAMGALQAGIVLARPLPAFKDGVVGFKGKGTGTSDDNHVLISNGESVIKAKQTMKHRELLEAVNNDTFDKYLNDRYISPLLAIKEKQRSKQNEELETLSKKYMAMQLAMGGTDLSRLESLTKRNKSVSLNNADAIGKAIARNISKGKYEL